MTRDGEDYRSWWKGPESRDLKTDVGGLVQVIVSLIPEHESHPKTRVVIVVVGS